MADDLADLEHIAGAMLARLSTGGRFRLLRAMARDLRTSQTNRIAAQRNPDGEAYAARKAKREETAGAYPVRFLYPKGDPDPRVVFMKSWARQGPLLTGYDIEAGGVRSFFWDKVDRFLGIDKADENKSAGKLRRRGSIRRTAMFKKLRNRRNLQAGSTDRELWVGFTGRAAAIARIHQEGLKDRPAAKAKPVRYAKRELIGLTVADRRIMLDTLVAHVVP